MKKKHPPRPGRIADNRRASFDVKVEQTYEAGLQLTGDEIKSIRADRVQLTGSYIKFLQGKPVLIGLHLSQAKDPERVRNVLLHQREINEIDELVRAKGKAAVPLELHFKRGWAKVTIGIGPGRKQRDKRQLLRTRDLDRQQQQDLRRK